MPGICSKLAGSKRVTLACINATPDKTERFAFDLRPLHEHMAAGGVYRLDFSPNKQRSGVLGQLLDPAKYLRWELTVTDTAGKVRGPAPACDSAGLVRLVRPRRTGMDLPHAARQELSSA